jgi:hypothetical protein
MASIRALHCVMDLYLEGETEDERRGGWWRTVVSTNEANSGEGLREESEDEGGLGNVKSSTRLLLLVRGEVGHRVHYH